MPTHERSVVYKVGAEFYYGEDLEPGVPGPIMFRYRIDGGSVVEHEATQEDKDKYPAEYAQFLERPVIDAKAAKDAAKAADDLAKRVAQTQADDKKAAADAEKAKKDAEKADADDADAKKKAKEDDEKKQAKPPFGGKGTR